MVDTSAPPCDEAKPAAELLWRMNMGLKIFKVQAEGDTMYIQAPTLQDARNKLKDKCGPIPESLLTWTRVDNLPEDEEFL